MSRKDDLTKKKRRVANNVSHSKRRTKKIQDVNLQKKRFYIPELKRWVRLKVTTRSMRSIAKMGLLQFAKKCGVKL